jgi:hypothetical protein
MQTQVIRPATGRLEGLWLALVCAVVLAVCTTLIVLRHTKLQEVQLQPYQISAFADLNKTEQGLFNDLYAAALEIQSVHRDSIAWLSVEDLQDVALPPFTQTSLSESRGAHKWTALPFDAPGTSVMAYFGKSAHVSDARSFLLVMTYRPPVTSAAGTAPDPTGGLSFTIWVNPNATVAAPKAVDTTALTDLAWREAVALKGEEIMRKEGKK